MRLEPRGPSAAACILRGPRYARAPQDDGLRAVDFQSKLSNSHVSFLLGRMSGRRTGVHFAWTCSAILAAGFPRERRIFFSLSLPMRERFCCPLEIEGAERRQAQLY